MAMKCKSKSFQVIDDKTEEWVESDSYANRMLVQTQLTMVTRTFTHCELDETSLNRKRSSVVMKWSTATSVLFDTTHAVRYRRPIQPSLVCCQSSVTLNQCHMKCNHNHSSDNGLQDIGIDGDSVDTVLRFTQRHPIWNLSVILERNSRLCLLFEVTKQ